jgi:hypothetical protein
MAEVDEIVHTVERLDHEFNDLVIRGLRAVGPQHLTALTALRQEFERIGAMHLAERIGTLVTAIKNDDRTAAEALLRAQTSLRVFERLLTVQTMREALAQAAHAEATPTPDAEDEDEDEDEEDDE